MVGMRFKVRVRLALGLKVMVSVPLGAVVREVVRVPSHSVCTFAFDKQICRFDCCH